MGIERQTNQKRQLDRDERLTKKKILCKWSSKRQTPDAANRFHSGTDNYPMFYQ